jgi:hypothetical protein
VLAARSETRAKLSEEPAVECCFKQVSSLHHCCPLLPAVPISIQGAAVVERPDGYLRAGMHFMGSSGPRVVHVNVTRVSTRTAGLLRAGETDLYRQGVAVIGKQQSNNAPSQVTFSSTWEVIVNSTIVAKRPLPYAVAQLTSTLFRLAVDLGPLHYHRYRFSSSC